MIGANAFAGAASGEQHDGEEPGTDGTVTTTYGGTLDEENQQDTYSFEATAGEGIELEMRFKTSSRAATPG